MNIETKTAKSVEELIQAGDFTQAVVTAKQVLESEPDDIYCLSVIAQAEFNEGRLDEAKDTLIKAHKLNSSDININRNLGLICNKQGEYSDSALYFLKSIENNKDHPEVLLDFLLMGISVSKISLNDGVRIIDWVFNQNNHLKLGYQNQQEIAFIREASTIGNTLLRDCKYQQQKSEIEALVLGFDESEKQRLLEFLEIFHGFKHPEYADPMQKPTYHMFPGLKPYPFYDADDFSWAKLLEQNYTGIKDELMSLYKSHDDIRPYIDGVVTGNVGLDGLADSLDWSSIHLIKAGEYKNDILSQCPKTNEVISQMPLPTLAGNGPEVFLSVLKANTEIKPHHGLSNIKLTVHLGLEIPDNCALRSGPETQTWENGKVMIFDDTFEHEAWNRSDKDRFVLIMEVWHPDLTELEKQGIQKIQELQHQFSVETSKESFDSLVEKTVQLLN